MYEKNVIYFEILYYNEDKFRYYIYIYMFLC